MGIRELLMINRLPFSRWSGDRFGLVSVQFIGFSQLQKFVLLLG